MENKAELIARFEAEMARVKRPGVDKLMDYIRKSDFYTAPASTKFHLSCTASMCWTLSGDCLTKIRSMRTAPRCGFI